MFNIAHHFGPKTEIDHFGEGVCMQYNLLQQRVKKNDKRPSLPTPATQLPWLLSVDDVFLFQACKGIVIDRLASDRTKAGILLITKTENVKFVQKKIIFQVNHVQGYSKNKK